MLTTPMKSKIARVLRKWREAHLTSAALSSLARPIHSICVRSASQMERKVRKNGVEIQLPNGTSLRIAEDAGIAIASILFWHGIEGYERETSQALCYLFERACTFIDVGANYGFYSLLGPLWNPSLHVVAFEPVPQNMGRIETKRSAQSPGGTRSL